MGESLHTGSIIIEDNLHSESIIQRDRLSKENSMQRDTTQIGDIIPGDNVLSRSNITSDSHVRYQHTDSIQNRDVAHLDDN